MNNENTACNTLPDKPSRKDTLLSNVVDRVSGSAISIHSIMSRLDSITDKLIGTVPEDESGAEIAQEPKEATVRLEKVLYELEIAVSRAERTVRRLEEVNLV